MPENIEEELENLQFELKTLYAKDKRRGDKAALEERIDLFGTFIKRQKFFNAWNAYEKLKAKKEVQDYSDLNINALKLIEKNPEIAKWKYLVIDEFQDTNKIQIDLITKLAYHDNVTVVGDLNQSIYRFRGAYKDNLTLFKQTLKVMDSDIYTLDKSHRSSNKILKVAHTIITKNYSFPEDCLLVVSAYNKEGSKLEVTELVNGKEEVRKIIEIIKSELETRKPEDICVIFRTHQQAHALKRALEHEHIPFQSAAKKPLLKQNAIKNILNHLEVINSLKNNTKPDIHALWDIIHQAEFPQEEEIKISNFLKKNRDKDNLGEKILTLDKELELSDISKIKYELIVKKIKTILEHANKQIPELVKEVCDILGNKDVDTKEGQEILLGIEELKKKINEQNNYEFYDLSSFLHHIKVMKMLEVELEAPALEKKGIVVMTAHATKGLEYPVVIIAAMAQKKFPIEKMTLKQLVPAELMPDIKEEIKKLPRTLREEAIKEIEYENQLKEERRLCYVALTRAKEQVYITYAQEYGGKRHEPSQFLREADYRENADIRYTQDLEQKYQDPEILTTLSEHEVKEITFSPSNLKLFLECQKRYEFKYVLGMPDPEPPAWEAIKLGSFVHQIIERGIKAQIRSEQEFVSLAKEEAQKPEWQGLELNEAMLLLKIFFQRNKNKYSITSKTEERLFTRIEGFRFQGIADRIDFHSDGLEIIDYKTGQAAIAPRDRNWQLGYYALACAQFGTVKQVTLDMLKHDKPLEFVIDENGTALEKNNKKMSFNIYEVKKELVETAQKIMAAYKEGFKACPLDKNCEFCNEYVYNS
jgi:superfamily I DNA/RNA helicase/RecB family exonuclease